MPRNSGYGKAMGGAAKEYSRAKGTSRKPHGLAAESTYPLTKRKGLTGRGASRVLKGTDRKRQRVGVTLGSGKMGSRPGSVAKRIEGKYF